MAVKLKQIAEAIEDCNDESQAFVNAKTGELEWILEYAMGQSEIDEIIEKIEEGEDADDWHRLPTSFEVNAYGMMEDFAESVEDRKGAVLASALRGRGAFRRFKDAVYELNLEDSWFKYKDLCYLKAAARWCEDHEIEYEVESDQ